MARRTFWVALLSAILVACSSSASPAQTTAPSAQASPAPLQPASPSTAAASSAPAATASPTPAPSLSALNVLWKKSGPIAGKTVTYWPAINPKTDNVWVADGEHDRYWIFKPDGTFVEAWGASGSGPGQLNLKTHDVHPDGVGAIAFAPDGGFYVADAGNDRIQRFDADRKFVKQWGEFGTGDGQFTSAKGIATDGQSVFVSDDARGDIQVFDTNGTFVRSFAFPFVLFTLDPAGHLDVVDNGGSHSAFVEFDQTGTSLKTIDLSAAVSALGGSGSQPAVDKGGHIYIGFQSDPEGPVGTLELDSSGAVLHEWAGGSETIALSPDGTAAYLAYTGPPDGGWPYLEKVELPAK